MYKVSQQAYLMHHGVKGMKWGVRKDRTKGGFRQKRQEAQEAKKQNAMKLLATGKNQYKAGSGYKLGKDGSMELEPGLKLQNISSAKPSNKDFSHMTYTSFTQNDNTRYVARIGSANERGRNNVYSMTVTQKIKAPSTKEASDVFLHMVKTRPDIREELAKDPVASMILPKIKDKNMAKMESDPKLRQSMYQVFNVTLISDELVRTKSAYTAALKERGYNAIRDENDSTNGISKNPIILLDAANTTRLDRVDQLTKQDIKMAKVDLKTLNEGEKWLKKHGLGYRRIE